MIKIYRPKFGRIEPLPIASTISSRILSHQLYLPMKAYTNDFACEYWSNLRCTSAQDSHQPRLYRRRSTDLDFYISEMFCDYANSRQRFFASTPS